MKKLLLSATVLMLVQSCSSQTQDTSLLSNPNVTQAYSNVSNKSLDNPNFIKKLQNPAKYRAAAKPTNSICGTDDLQQVNSYDGKLGEPIEFVVAHKDPVGAMESGNTDKTDKFCSGALISKDLFLTASHCIDDTTTKSQYVAFNYEKAKGSNTLLPQKHFKITEVVEDHTNGLDYAIIRLAGDPGNEFSWDKLRPEVPAMNDMLTIIQHPSGEPKQVEVGQFAGVEGNYMTYKELDTEPGSSGSSVLDANGAVVAVHTNGGCTATGGANRGVLLSEIAKVSKTVQELSHAAPAPKKTKK